MNNEQLTKNNSYQIELFRKREFLFYNQSFFNLITILFAKFSFDRHFKIFLLQ